MATTHDRYTIVQGFAGVGKSTMLEQGKTLIEQTQALRGNAKIEVLGLAPTHAAVNELKEKGIPAQTTQSLLKDLLMGDTTPTSTGIPCSYSMKARWLPTLNLMRLPPW
ncbi:AAA family ATPase [Photobacterium damselae subsp. piscicida]|nr:AAA family ATPase [Photobacterium damselae subsp. piscicida]